MYLWVACKLPEEFEKEIRQHCLKLNENIGLDTVAFDLPQHISLKISFQTDRADDILDDLSAFLAAQKPFSAHIAGAEQAGNILWLPVNENAQLKQLHAELDSRLEGRFGIPQHEFDRCFLFHSTLFLDADTQKVARMGDLLTSYPICRELRVDTFLLGASETGMPGTYRVVREIKV